MSELERAKERAVRFIAHCARTEAQVRKKLEQSGFSGDAISLTLEYLKEIGYIDDDAYAKAYAQEAREKYGPYAVKAKLVQRGIDRDAAERASAQSGDEQRQAAERLIEKLKKRYQDVPEEKKRARIFAALSRAGFDWDEVKELL